MSRFVLKNLEGTKLQSDEYLNYLEDRYKIIMDSREISEDTKRNMVEVLKVDLKYFKFKVKNSTILSAEEQLNLSYQIDLVCEDWGHKESGKKLNCTICHQPLL